MKKLFLAVFLILPVPAFALTYEIIGPCAEAPLSQGEFSTGPGTVGRITLAILDSRNIPYIGAERGIHSIYGTPVGEEAIEIISREEMRVYGWCYEVDGVRPELMPDKVVLNGREHLKWFFAYSHYLRGQWLSYCDSAYAIKPAKLCPTGN